MLTLIIQSAVAGAAFGIAAIVALALVKTLLRDKEGEEDRKRIREQNELIEKRLLRSAIAHEASAANLSRIANQLEQNGNGKA